ncbi:ABC transporter ATP-binding protein [Corynebacterium freneyi]|uniref:ATP-binding cassette domain-containing protein n=1 Tax=Corynebacterium freneyi TaxID=134034 RepID=UPI001EF1776B|nr:ABC transporter ATP-binding protein [Corynebacterium freneyi]MCG7439831.1 ABC transporter ATP-binding protein/permease [Corynebacterium freneyi]
MSWIREALVSPPEHGWTVVGLGWLRSALAALAAVFIGAAVDAALTGGGWAGPLAWFAAAAIGAAIAGGVAEALPGAMRGTEERSWRRRVLGAVLADPPGPGVREVPEGELIDAATSSVESTAGYRADFLAPTLASFTAPLVVLAMWAIFVDPVGAAALAVFVAIVPVVIVAAGRRLRRSNGEYRRRQARATARYLEMIEGLGTLRVLGAAGRARDAFAESARGAMRELTRLLARNQMMIIVNDAIFGIVMGAAATAFILWQLTAGALSPGAALAALLMTVLLHEPIDRVGRTFYVGLGGRAHRDRIDAMAAGAANLDATSAAHSPADPAELSASSAAHSPAAPPTGDIDLTGVSVSVPGARLLDDVTLHIPEGARVSVVGPSGAGKTTLLRVLAGAIDYEGEIAIGGVAADRPTLREATGVVTQHPGIFGTTIADNLRLADPGADAGAMTAALRRAHVADELLGRPGGLDAVVGDRGAHLSGGQRRRLGIARAFLRDRPVLLLDEPTADLDRSTEAHVRAALAEARRGRTTITVAHRLDATADADIVVVLVGGRVTASGTPAEVRAMGGYYADALDAEDGARSAGQSHAGPRPLGEPDASARTAKEPKEGTRR